MIDGSKENYHSMPVEFTNRPFSQVLLRSRNIVARRKIGNDLLTNPAAFEDPCLRVGKAPFQVWNHAVVGCLPA